MAGKRRRLSQASVYRYYLKRFTMNFGTGGHLLAEQLASDPEVRKAVARKSYYETYDWLTDYQSSHLAKQIAKNVAQKYNVPTSMQGLLMAYAEKVVANYMLEWKNETLTEMHDNFLKELQVKTPVGAPGITTGYLYTFALPNGKTVTVDMSAVLTEIERELFKYIRP